MIKKKIFMRTITVILCLILSMGISVRLHEAYAYPAEYNYLFKTPEDNAYLTTGVQPESRYCSMIGSDNPSDLRYATQTIEEGVDSAYFGGAHYLDVRYDRSFYDDTDNTLIVSVVFYDYGPGQGTFYVNYNDSAGSVKTLSLIKPGTNPMWSVKTLVITDIDMTKTFEDGAHIRVECSAYGKNAFKKVETVNVSKQRREGRAAQITCIGTDVDGYLKDLGFIESNDARFAKNNFSAPCSMYDLQKMFCKITNKSAVDIPLTLQSRIVTQGELADAYLELLGYASVDNAIDFGTEIGILSAEDLILSAASPATIYNLMYITYASVYHTRKDGGSLISDLIDKNYFSNEFITTTKDSNFLEVLYKEPRKLPYTKITDQETGRTYYYINFFGQEMRRPYMTLECWSEDGKGMLVGRMAGSVLNLFYYNVEEQTIRFVDTNIVNYGEGVDAIVGCDNRVYYVKKEQSTTAIYRADFITFTPEKLYELPKGISLGGLSLSNDCRYIACEYHEPYTEDKDYPEGSQLGGRLDLETGKWEVFYHNWELQNRMMHVQVNPEYPDLLFYCHDMATPQIGRIEDRIWTIDLTTGKQKNIFEEGVELGNVNIIPTHETWTLDGEKLSFVSFGQMGSHLLHMIDKDGRYRRRFENPYGYEFAHCFASGDHKYIVADGHYITLLNTETEQFFKISRWVHDGRTHPYHAHPIVARNQYLVSWGAEYDGVLGVYWYDFSEIAESEIAEGGHYPVGTSAYRISYKGLDCETEETLKAGKDCIRIGKGKSLYLDIKSEVIDNTNGEVIVSFDYYSNNNCPIVCTYTRGVTQPIDYAERDNCEILVKRRGTGGWEHAEFTIEGGNFENPGKYASDIKIRGISSEVYISNINIKRKE